MQNPDTYQIEDTTWKQGKTVAIARPAERGVETLRPVAKSVMEMVSGTYRYMAVLDVTVNPSGRPMVWCVGDCGRRHFKVIRKVGCREIGGGPINA